MYNNEIIYLYYTKVGLLQPIFLYIVFWLFSWGGGIGGIGKGDNQQFVVTWIFEGMAVNNLLVFFFF